jgi:hypothetical protein
MTRDDIIRMMREAGFTVQREDQLFTGIFERFAALVAAAEREACAQVAVNARVDDASNYPLHIATAIRARSKE